MIEKIAIVQRRVRYHSRGLVPEYMTITPPSKHMHNIVENKSNRDNTVFACPCYTASKGQDLQSWRRESFALRHDWNQLHVNSEEWKYVSALANHLVYLCLKDYLNFTKLLWTKSILCLLLGASCFCEQQFKPAVFLSTTVFKLITFEVWRELFLYKTSTTRVYFEVHLEKGIRKQ